MKIGDKVRIKKDAFGLEGNNLNGKMAECVDIDEYGYSFLCGDEEFLVTAEGLDCFFEPTEYQPKHAKEMVNHPDHYNQGKYECIDEMIALFGVEAVIGFCTCNIYKYKTRAPYKNGDEDLKKAEWYMDKLVELQAISTMERE